jgi:hypothetical protein
MAAVALHALPRALADHEVRETVRAAAEALAERQGVKLIHLWIDADGLEAEVEGASLVAMGFAAELRTTTTRWALHRGLGELWRS